MNMQQVPDLQAIHPNKGAKFSPNLHKYLARRRQLGSLRMQRVFVDQDKHLWLGYFDGDLFIGARLIQAMCNGAKTQTMAYVKMRSLVEVPDFWHTYEAIGRCATDPEHRMPFVGDDTRWSVQGDHRFCLWCGQGHQRQVQQVKQETHNVWVPAEPEACTI